MFHLVIKIDREVTADELAELAKFSKLLRKGDTFALTPLIPAAASVEAPVAPSKPVIVPSGKHRRWSEILGNAFARVRNDFPNDGAVIDIIENTFAWADAPREEWVPYRKDSLKVDVGVKEDPYPILYNILRYLGRQPQSKGNELFLPPTMMTWTRKVEAERREQEEANLKLTGDPHIGFPTHDKTSSAVTPPDVMRKVLDKLDWSPLAETKPMMVREFLAWAGLPFTRGNAVRLGKIAMEEYGGFKVDHRDPRGVVYKFPLPKGGTY